MTATAGIRNHDKKGGGLPAGLFVGAVTETSAANGPVNSVNNYGFRDVITRDFQVNRTNPGQDPAVAPVELDASLVGVLTANPGRLAPAPVRALVSADAEILQGGTSLLDLFFVDSTFGRNQVNENATDSGFRTLSVDVTYTLRLTLETEADSSFGADMNATSARSDFLNTLQGTLLVLPEPSPLTLAIAGALGALIVLGRRHRVT